MKVTMFTAIEWFSCTVGIRLLFRFSGVCLGDAVSCHCSHLFCIFSHDT
jgi:hypothetical protein